MYCIMGFDDPYCASCAKYTLCKAGYGVSVKGKEDLFNNQTVCYDDSKHKISHLGMISLQLGQSVCVKNIIKGLVLQFWNSQLSLID